MALLWHMNMHRLTASTTQSDGDVVNSTEAHAAAAGWTWRSRPTRQTKNARALARSSDRNRKGIARLPDAANSSYGFAVKSRRRVKDGRAALAYQTKVLALATDGQSGHRARGLAHMTNARPLRREAKSASRNVRQRCIEPKNP